MATLGKGDLFSFVRNTPGGGGGEAFPNERRIRPALSRLGIIFSSARESGSLASIPVSHPAAPAEPGARRRW